MPPDRMRWTATLVAVGGPVVVALVLLPFRSETRAANVALVLVLVVLAAAILGGRRGGVLAALVATLAFDALYTRPYGSLRIATRDDVETTLLLLGVGVVAGELVTRARRNERAAARSRAEIERMRRVAEVGAGSDAPGRLIDNVRRELIGLIAPERCWFEVPPFETKMPRLTHGRVVMPTDDPRVMQLDPTPSRLVELRVFGNGEVQGRFVLEFAVPTIGLSIPAEARTVAVALADQLGVALAARSGTSD
jgi:hypothetical protein